MAGTGTVTSHLKNGGEHAWVWATQDYLQVGRTLLLRWVQPRFVMS